MRLPQSIQPNTATIQKYEGDGAYGPTYADPIEVKGYFQQKEKMIRDDEGDEVVSMSQFYTGKDIDVPKGSILTFNGEHIVQTTSRKLNALTGQFSHLQIWLR